MGNLREDSSSDSRSLSLPGSENRGSGSCKCLRRGCENHYTPRRPNQQFCGQPECQRLVRRWQAAKRQRRVRETEQGRQRHNRRERERRLAKRQRRDQASAPEQPAVATISPPQRAWSRCKAHPKDFCDRPGCYDPVRPSRSRAARYCGNSCRRAVERVRDRCRKHFKRQQFKQEHPVMIDRDSSQRSQQHSESLKQADHPMINSKDDSQLVRDYRSADITGLSSEAFSRRQVNAEQRDSGSLSRPPPAQE